MSDTRSEPSSAIVTVRANGRKSSPATPLTKAIGTKTARVVMVDAVTAEATSFTAPRIAARRSTGGMRPSAPGKSSAKCRAMFSVTTMESSTTRPIAIVMAPSVRMFRE